MLGLSKIIVVGQCSHGKYFVWNRIIPAVWLDCQKKNQISRNFHLFGVETLKKVWNIFKVNNKDTRTTYWGRSNLFIVNLEHVSHLFRMFSLLTLSLRLLAWDAGNWFSSSKLIAIAPALHIKENYLGSFHLNFPMILLCRSFKRLEKTRTLFSGFDYVCREVFSQQHLHADIKII